MQTSGLHHIVLTIAQVERSRTFYRDLLGFDTTDMSGGGFDGFSFQSGGVAFFLNAGQVILGDRFNEFRVGLDHLSFSAPNKEALYELAEKLIAAGVDTKGVEQFAPSGNWYVAFRDPDNIQLEYWLP